MKEEFTRKFCCLVSTSLKNETRGLRIVRCLVSTSLKNETRVYEDSYFTMSTLLKNETSPYEQSSFSYDNLIKKMKQGDMIIFHFLCQSHKKMKQIPPLIESHI